MWFRGLNCRSCSTVLAPNVNPAQGVFIEMFITAILCMAVLMLAAEKVRIAAHLWCHSH